EKKSKNILVFALVAAVLVIGGILFLVMSSDKEPGSTVDVAAQSAVPARAAPPAAQPSTPAVPEAKPSELQTAEAVAVQPEPEVAPAPDPLPEPEPIITTGKLRLNSEPQGAEVWVASTLRGTTPLSVVGLEQGEYGFELRKPGFVTLQGTFEIVAEQETVLQGLTLNPELGALLIASNLDNVSVVITALESEATVYEGYLPLELDSLRPGRYRAVAEKEGWSAIELDISVQPKTASKYRMDFPLASVRVTANRLEPKSIMG
ncbi:MAG: PEGA domain-containing protein, partial [Verrucomicrobia bacterium]|nr:PEGA domain-containing protein [Verrucomicrobiota bacterium]